ncbi:MAG: hypothetical protein D6739_10285 [Nitrospirae bacterium]|nr:MAG: hypothetical protein D6739_10285 [Nitrospirota bacterium]
MRSAGDTAPAASASSATKGLMVEPGGYSPRRARSWRGWPGSRTSSRHSAAERPATNRLGSYAGEA